MELPINRTLENGVPLFHLASGTNACGSCLRIESIKISVPLIGYMTKGVNGNRSTPTSLHLDPYLSPA